MARPSSGGTELSESDDVSEGFGQLLKEEASPRAVGERARQQLGIPSPGARSQRLHVYIYHKKGHSTSMWSLLMLLL